MMLQKSFKLLVLLIIVGCNSVEKQLDDTTVFSKLKSEETNVLFSNNLKETDSLNYFKYTSIYMGGGVSVGDINNDGLVDIFFTGNQVSNKLYLNKGNLQFEDITKKQIFLEIIDGIQE